MKRPTKERLEEIRSLQIIDCTEELFAEIDALTAEWNTHEDHCRDIRYNLETVTEERNKLQSKNAQMEEVLKIMADIGLCKGCMEYNKEGLEKFMELERGW